MLHPFLMLNNCENVAQGDWWVHLEPLKLGCLMEANQFQNQYRVQKKKRIIQCSKHIPFKIAYNLMSLQEECMLTCLCVSIHVYIFCRHLLLLSNRHRHYIELIVVWTSKYNKQMGQHCWWLCWHRDKYLLLSSVPPFCLMYFFHCGSCPLLYPM